ncbi:MAG: hypothetical protein QME51_04335 [Planctomycetota bacterium]|nr:hypothetical protein [Planctomycetota bacterium]
MKKKIYYHRLYGRVMLLKLPSFGIGSSEKCLVRRVQYNNKPVAGTTPFEVSFRALHFKKGESYGRLV